MGQEVLIAQGDAAIGAKDPRDGDPLVRIEVVRGVIVSELKEEGLSTGGGRGEQDRRDRRGEAGKEDRCKVADELRVLLSAQ
jgi:hypothetical protein